MNLAVSKLARPMAMTFVVAALTMSIAVLAIDCAMEVRSVDELAERLRLAEDAAREDPAAAEAFEKEVARQTATSLARTRRQRIASIAALMAAGVCLALLKVGKTAEHPAPRLVVDAVTRRAKVTPPESLSEPCASDNQAVPPVDLSPVDTFVAQIGREQRHLIPLLHAVNQHYRYLPPPALARLAESTRIPQEQITGVASFYTQFRNRPRGEHVVQVCRGTACHVAGADRILEELRRELHIPPGHDTDPAGVATIEAVGCLGCCTLAPVVEVDDQIEGHVSVQALPNIVDWSRCKSDQSSVAYKTAPTTNGNADTSTPQLEIRIGLGSCCVAGGSRDVMESLQKEIASRRLDAVIKPVGCVGICHLTPLVEIVMSGAEPIVATRATPADIRRIIHALPGKAPWPQRWRNRLADSWRRDEQTNNGSATSCQICPISDARLRRFVDPQVRIVTEHSGEMDPASLEQYRARDGFIALERCLRQQQPTSIVEAIEVSGLRGRGGGGYPTAAKWRKVSQATGEKFLVCNGDEGDPGAFMDRMVMESYPYRVLEGMAIAAYAVGAQRAFFYVRHEYPLAVRRLRHAIDRLTAAGLLGKAILGTDFSFQVEIVEGAGAFVCGEETALLQSIMGHRGTPQLRPPYPVDRGLFDRPTLVNNVETFANVPWILRHGPERFAALGTAASKGTKVFSLAGKVRRAGLIEIPMGLTIRQVVEQIGGGVAEGKRFKAVQIGGPSGGCVPAELADTPIDYENLHRVGAILGSGGLVVLDDDDCMVDVARYFLEFTQRESCGHCTFCRVGTRKLLDILERLCAGKGRPKDLDEIEALSQSVSMGSLCGLGKTAPNPVLSTLKYFREEYEAHLKGHCPAGRCKALIRYEVTRDCVGCTLCRSALSGGGDSPHAVSSAPHQFGRLQPLRRVSRSLSRASNHGGMMVQLWIDNMSVQVDAGQSVLAALRHLGIDVPAMCHQDGHSPNTSCMCCLVRVDGAKGVVPSCATTIREGMRVESETDQIHELRRTGIELLLADHAGDCHAPCENTCPARMDVPDMLRHVAEGDYRAAIETVKRDIALPAILGRVCPEVCENACRRGQHDSPAAICKIKQFVADRDLESASPYHPPIAALTGKRVAIVGGGPTGLTAAYHLSQRGHQCVLIDQQEQLGGRLRDEFSTDELPRDVLQNEAEAALALGAEKRLSVQLGTQLSLDDLANEFDAVLLAMGRSNASWFNEAGIRTTTSGVRVDAQSRMTSRIGVFAAGNAVRPYHLVVQSVAEGKLVAQCLDAWLRGAAVPDRRHKFETRLARLTSGELCDYCEDYPDTPRMDTSLPVVDLSDEQARREAERCLGCDCAALDTCGLHHYAAMYHCDAHRFRDSDRRFEGRIVGDEVVLELGKCILCGICVQLAREADDAVGLSFLGRSIETRIGPPHGATLDQALGSAARRCAEACPTGAITLTRKR